MDRPEFPSDASSFGNFVETSPGLSVPSQAEIIGKHARRVEIPYNSCRSVSHKLANDLACNGIHARVMRCSGLRTDAPDADSRWLELGPQSQWVHFVVQTNNCMIDLTRTQFFPLSANPFLQDIGTFAEEWSQISQDSLASRFRTPN